MTIAQMISHVRHAEPTRPAPRSTPPSQPARSARGPPAVAKPPAMACAPVPDFSVRLGHSSPHHSRSVERVAPALRRPRRDIGGGRIRRPGAHDSRRPSGVRCGPPVARGQRLVQLHPLVQLRDQREPAERGVVAVRTATTPPGLQTRRISRSACTGSATCLQHLVGWDRVEAVGRQGSPRRGRRRPRIRTLGVPCHAISASARASASWLISGAVTMPGHDPVGQIGGDRAGPAADVQHREARLRCGNR